MPHEDRPRQSIDDLVRELLRHPIAVINGYNLFQRVRIIKFEELWKPIDSTLLNRRHNMHATKSTVGRVSISKPSILKPFVPKLINSIRSGKNGHLARSVKLPKISKHNKRIKMVENNKGRMYHR